MKLARLEILDTYGTERIAFEPAAVTFIRGDNGTGKTSIINSVMSIFDGGFDPGIIRRGAKRSVVRMILDDGAVIEKVTTSGGCRLEVKDSHGMVVPKPATFIQELGESIGVNPARLLKIDTSTKPGKRDLMNALLETMRIEFNLEEFAAIAPKTVYGEIQPGFPEAIALIRAAWPKEKVDLERFERIVKQFEETRRKSGQERDEAGHGADALQKAIPPAEDGETARARLVEVESALAFLARDEKAETLTVTEEYNARERALREEFNRAYQALTEEKHRRTGEIALKYAERGDPLKTKKTELRQRIQQADEAAGARKQIEIMRERYRKHADQYDQFSTCLDLLRSAKGRKLENLPIEGLTFDDGEVYVDGVRWQDVNTARRIESAIQHADLRRGKLNLIIDDDAEHLSEETQRMLLDGLTAAGYQVILAEIRSGSPLEIVTVPSFGPRPDGTFAVER